MMNNATWQLLSFVLAISMISNPLIASAQEEVEVDVEEWITYYYLEPAPEQVPSRIKQLSSTGVFDQPDAVPPLAAFMTEVFRQNPARLAQWSEELAQLPPQHRHSIWWALWNTNLPEAHATLKAHAGTDPEEIQKIMASKPVKLLARLPAYPAELDMLWATFMASGNPAVVERIIDVLAVPLPEQGHPDRVDALLLLGSAKWSLESNMRQHKQVEQICRARLAKASGLLQQELAEVVREAEENAKRQGL